MCKKIWKLSNTFVILPRFMMFLKALPAIFRNGIMQHGESEMTTDE